MVKFGGQDLEIRYRLDEIEPDKQVNAENKPPDRRPGHEKSQGFDAETMIAFALMPGVVQGVFITAYLMNKMLNQKFEQQHQNNQNTGVGRDTAESRDGALPERRRSWRPSPAPRTVVPCTFS